MTLVGFNIYCSKHSSPSYMYSRWLMVPHLSGGMLGGAWERGYTALLHKRKTNANYVCLQSSCPHSRNTV